jgi:hypothetical protein
VFTNPRYIQDNGSNTGIATDEGMSIPLDPDNTDYQEIMRLVDAGELTIAEPD